MKIYTGLHQLLSLQPIQKSWNYILLLGHGVDSSTCIWLPDPRIRSDPRSAENSPVLRSDWDPWSNIRKSERSGSGIRIRQNLNLDPDPWIRDPRYFCLWSGSGIRIRKNPDLRSDPSDLWDPSDPVGSRISGIRGSWDPTITDLLTQKSLLFKLI